MILAAGFGTRLKPLTLTTPKALVSFEGVPMIEIVLKKLISAGIKEVIINTHHFSEQINKYFSDRAFPLRIQLVQEEEILGTGGGIKNAAPYLKDAENFLVHNVDVLSEIDIIKLYDFHLKESAFVSLSVQNRKTSRPLLIDENNYIIGRVSRGQHLRYKTPHGSDKEVAFSGIHVISCEIFNYFPQEKFFDIFAVYFDLIKANKKIIGCDSGNVTWRDLGNYHNISRNSTKS
jgi:mannose-1-phosphate guanylyltransferase